MFKRIINLGVTVLLMVSLFVSNAYASEAETTISIRNGIEFGMTKQEVAALETATRDYSLTDTNCYRYVNVTIAGVKDCQLRYYFDDNGKLYRIKMDFYPDEDKYTRLSAVQPNYTKVGNALASKYGFPLGNKDGYTHGVQTSTLEFHLQMSDLSKLLIAIQGKGQLSEQYDEWDVNCGDGHVKIDHVFSHLVGIYGTTTCSHEVEYRYYTETEWREAIDARSEGV